MLSVINNGVMLEWMTIHVTSGTYYSLPSAYSKRYVGTASNTGSGVCSWGITTRESLSQIRIWQNGQANWDAHFILLGY